MARLLAALTDQIFAHESNAGAIAAFKRANDEAAIRGNVESGMVYRVAELSAGLAGFIGLRENKHIFHMFVDPGHQRRGVARALWTTARAAARNAGNEGLFTVNSSNYAVPVYEVFGFARTDTMQFKDGIYYNPMAFEGERR